LGHPQDSRKRYCSARPWKTAGMSREQFDQILAVLPEGAIDEIHLKTDADQLIATAFGE
jgi:beta-galactosidase/beta-glucuronidase